MRRDVTEKCTGMKADMRRMCVGRKIWEAWLRLRTNGREMRSSYNDGVKVVVVFVVV